MDNLTSREREVLGLIVQAKSTKQVAAILGISFKTAACHRQRLLSKTGAPNTAGLVMLALREGLVADGDAHTAPVADNSSDDRSYQLRLDQLAEAVARGQALRERCRMTHTEFREAQQEMRASWNRLMRTLTAR